MKREHPELVGLAIALRTAAHTYIHHQEESAEFYDRTTDPDETTNLIDDPRSADSLRSLEKLLTGWLVETTDVIEWDRDPRFPPCPDGYRKLTPNTT